jgi:protocatechuate 3,4-dioxygenase, beta subunit
MNKILVTTLLLFILIHTGCSQNSSERVVGGGCEGCEAVDEYGKKKLNAVDTLPDFNEPGPKIQISGTIYKKDGKTPAKDVVLYIYHTDQSGEYSTKGNETGWARRHGYIRGWVKTGTDGKYTFYTLVPKAYPGRKDPAHIHPVIREPGVAPYWIDEYLFDDDPLLTAEQRSRQEKRGGSGILKTSKGANGLLIAKRDIVLGQNISGY